MKNRRNIVEVHGFELLRLQCEHLKKRGNTFQHSIKQDDITFILLLYFSYF
jgi:hypothetical protein